MNSYKKVVVKLGTNVLTRANGALDITSISHIVDQIVQLKQQGIASYFSVIRGSWSRAFCYSIIKKLK